MGHQRRSRHTRKEHALASTADISSTHTYSITLSARATNVAGTAKRIGGLDIDHQLELVRLLDGNISGLCPAQQLDQLPRENIPKNLFQTRAIGD